MVLPLLYSSMEEAMTQEAFEVIVGVSGTQNRTNAIANATRYLHDDGLVGDVFDVNVYGGGDSDWGIGICHNIDVPDGESYTELAESLPDVESVERVSYQRL